MSCLLRGRRRFFAAVSAKRTVPSRVFPKQRPKTGTALPILAILLGISATGPVLGQTADRWNSAPPGSATERKGSPPPEFGPVAILDLASAGDSEFPSPAPELHEQPIEALALLGVDLDNDGVPDLIRGFRTSSGGLITLHLSDTRRGDGWRAGDAAPASPHRFSRSLAIPLDFAPEFLEAGDFNGDGRRDLIAADSEQPVLRFFANPGNLAFGAPEEIPLNGVVTAMRAGEFGRPNSRMDLVVAVRNADGAELLVFGGLRGTFEDPPASLPLEGEAHDLALANLDGDRAVDLLVTMESELWIVHGDAGGLARRGSSFDPPDAAAISRYPFADRILASAVGNFTGERKSEIAVLTAAGGLKLLSPAADGGFTAPISTNIPLGTYGRDDGGTRPSLVRANLSGRSRHDLVLSRNDFRNLLVLRIPSARDSSIPGDRGGDPVALVSLPLPARPGLILPIDPRRYGTDDLLIQPAAGSDPFVLPTQSGSTIVVNCGEGEDDFECGPERCTLRGAITKANSTPGTNTITFAVDTVVLGRAPAEQPWIINYDDLYISRPVIIDGGGNVRITAKDDSRFREAALHIGPNGGGSTITGLILGGFRTTTIKVEGGGDNAITGNVIGPHDLPAPQATFSVSRGVLVSGSADNRILGNQFPNVREGAIQIFGETTNTSVEDNLIGLDDSEEVGGSIRGIEIRFPATGTVVGGNTISGNSTGVLIPVLPAADGSPGGHLIADNRIGVSLDGARWVGGGTGISIQATTENTIVGNIIAGAADCINLGALTGDNEILSNFLGTNPAGDPLGCHGDGVVIRGGGNYLGDNHIAFNGQNGVVIQTLGAVPAVGNEITGNRIHDNGRRVGDSLGIDLGRDGVTPNDELDKDTGPNNLQNYPVLEKIPNTSNLAGTLHSRPNTSFWIELFSNDVCSPSGYGEGQSLLDAFSVATDGSGNADFVVANVPADKIFTATATDPDGNTSEFSACAGEAEREPFVVNSTGDDPDENYDPSKPAEEQTFDGICSTGRKADGTEGPCDPLTPGDCECTLRAAIQEANHRPGRDAIHFNIGGDVTVKVIRPGGDLPTITDEVLIDGYTQPGSVEATKDATASLTIELDGTAAGDDSDGLLVAASDSEVRGLAIHSFDRHGIVLMGSRNRVSGNHLGVDISGSELRQQPQPSADPSVPMRYGIYVADATDDGYVSADNRIGGERARDRNLIAGFDVGLGIFGPGATGNEVLGNHFCYDAAESKLLTKEMCSVVAIEVLDASGNRIGAETPNIIGGALFGIVLDGGENTRNNIIQGNLIGTDSTDPGRGNKLGNWVGILVGGDENLIGRSKPGEANTVASEPFFDSPWGPGHRKAGITLGSNAKGNHIQGNLIRDCPDYGIRITSAARDNFVGGPDASFGNTIIRNRVGVLIDSKESFGNRILSNRIYSNSVLDISLSEPDTPISQIKPRKNKRSLRIEDDDPSPGPNHRQNSPKFPGMVFDPEVWPVPFPYASIDPEGVLVVVELEGAPHEDFEIQFFAAGQIMYGDLYGDPGDLWDRCGGERYLGKLTVSSNRMGTAYAVARFPRTDFRDMDYVTTTATNRHGSTSEFGACATVLTDSDGDGVPDIVENLGPHNGDSNRDGVPDFQQPNVAVIPLVLAAVRGAADLIPVETTAAAMKIDATFSPSTARETFTAPSSQEIVPMGWTHSRQELAEGAASSWSAVAHRIAQGGAQAGGADLTYRLPEGLRVDGFYNFGPTPDHPTPHLYEFLFDGTTGAKILADRIEVHFVDGARGDHDLTVNGVIETLGGPVINGATFYFPQLGDGLAGDIRFQSGMVLANAGGIGPVQIDLADSAGRFLDLQFDGLGSGSLFRFGMTPGEALSTQTPGTDALGVGYAEIIAAEGMGGTAIFSRSDAGRGILLYETGVPAARPLSDFSLFVDSLGHRDTGLALVHPRTRGQEPGDASVTLRLYDKSFTLIGTRTLTLAPGEHLARFIHELFPGHAARASEMEGVVTVESDRELAAVTLRQNDDPARRFPDQVPTLTAFPVIPGRADDATPAASGERVFYFPQVADGVAPEIGIGLRTSMIFVNTGPDSQLRVELFDSNGTPMAVDLGVGGSSPVYEFALSSGHALSLRSPGTEGLKVGYARITAGGRIGGTAVFTLVHTPTGTLLYEAGVPAAERLAEFSLVVDSTGHRRTGVALVMPADQAGAESASLTLRLYDREFNHLAETQLGLAPGEHYARFVNEIFPDVEGVTEMLGSLTVHSDTPVAAVTLRETNDPTKAFPDAVPTLSAFPVIPGRAED